MHLHNPFNLFHTHEHKQHLVLFVAFCILQKVMKQYDQKCRNKMATQAHFVFIILFCSFVLTFLLYHLIFLKCCVFNSFNVILENVYFLAQKGQVTKKKICKSVFGTFFLQENITQFGPNQKSLKITGFKQIYIDIYRYIQTVQSSFK